MQVIKQNFLFPHFYFKYISRKIITTISSSWILSLALHWTRLEMVSPGQQLCPFSPLNSLWRSKAIRNWLQTGSSGLWASGLVEEARKTATVLVWRHSVESYGWSHFEMAAGWLVPHPLEETWVSMVTIQRLFPIRWQRKARGILNQPPDRSPQNGTFVAKISSSSQTFEHQIQIDP
jgi:hypothetical protein